MDRILAANTALFEDILQLSMVYKDEDNVDFEAIKCMYDQFHDNYRDSATHYKSCKRLHEVFGSKPDDLEQQLQLHRAAAEAYGFTFIEDEKLVGYSQCNVAHFTAINSANAAAAKRARDHLITFTIGVLKMPDTWILVPQLLSKSSIELDTSVDYPGSQSDNTFTGDNKLVVKQTEAYLRQKILTAASNTSGHMVRFHRDAWDAYTEGRGRSVEVKLIV